MNSDEYRLDFNNPTNSETHRNSVKFKDCCLIIKNFLKVIIENLVDSIFPKKFVQFLNYIALTGNFINMDYFNDIQKYTIKFDEF